MAKAKKPSTKAKLQNTVKLLTFLLTIDDLEVIKTSLESVVESLEEEINEP